MNRPPSCTSCGRALKAHCPSAEGHPVTRCAWWRCTNHVCGVDLHDFTRGVRRLTTGVLERLRADAAQI